MVVYFILYLFAIILEFLTVDSQNFISIYWVIPCPSTESNCLFIVPMLLVD